MAAQSLLLRDAWSVTASPPIKLQLPACRSIHVFMNVVFIFRSKVSPRKIAITKMIVKDIGDNE